MFFDRRQNSYYSLLNENDINDWRYYISIFNLIDITRYLPQIMHIALVTSFYDTFQYKIKYLRKNLNVPSRKQWLLQTDLNHVKDISAMNPSKYSNGSGHYSKKT